MDAESRAKYDRVSRRQFTDMPINKKRFRHKFYAFNISESWERRSGSSHDATCPPPSSINPFEQEIRDIRRQVNEDEVALYEAKSTEKELANDIDGVWRRIHDTEDFIRQIDDELLFLTSNTGTSVWVCNPTDGFVTALSTPWAEGRKIEMFKKRHDLQDAMAHLRQRLKKTTDLSRTHITKSEEIMLRKIEKEKKLHDLCKAWRASEFHGGENTAESDSWSGWDGWCCWDRQEMEFSREKKQQEAESSWESWEPPSSGVSENPSTSGLTQAEIDLIDLQETDANENVRFQTEQQPCGSTEGEDDAMPSAESVWTDEFNVDLLNLHRKEDVRKEDDLPDDSKNSWWPGEDKSSEATQILEKCESEWRQASWQEW